MMAALLLAAVLSVTAPAGAGHWEGYMQRGSARLQVRCDFPAEDPARGFFSAPALGAIDVPLKNVTDGAQMHWDLVGDTTTTAFDAAVSGDSMSGTFTDPAGNGTFVLHRLSASTQKPYVAQEVTFMNGGVRLAGTVFAPRTPGKHPAIIFVHGSGPEGRWASTYLADYAARSGIVALTYDKRGVGASGGDWRTSTMQDLINDARAGVNLLAHRDDVNRESVGVYGHSQGGELAPAIARNNRRVRWIIAADGPVGAQYRQDLYRVNRILAARYSGKALEDAQRLYAQFVDVARTGSPHAKLRADMKAAGNAPWLDDLAIPDDSSWIWKWYEKTGNYDNTLAWASVRVPVLLLFGQNDALVPPQESIATVSAILKRHKTPVFTRVFAGADHTLHIPAAVPGGWPTLPPGFPNVIVDFALSRGRTGPFVLNALLRALDMPP